MSQRGGEIETSGAMQRSVNTREESAQHSPRTQVGAKKISFRFPEATAVSATRECWSLSVSTAA